VKVASFNVNGIRARLPIICDWIAREQPDILCLQETKVQDADFPLEAFRDLSREVVFRGQKAYNGVAIISTSKPEDVQYGFGDRDAAEEPRLIAARIGDLHVVNTYVPQGTAPDHERFQYKLQWFRRLRQYFEKRFTPNDRVLWMGDLNVAPEPKDVYDPERLYGHVCFHPDEHQALAAVVEWGFIDVFRRHEPGEKQFSFYDYRLPQALERGLGWRVDHLLATPPLAEQSVRAWIDLAPRRQTKPSDHTPIGAEFKLD